jgi:hypothetical protein
VLISPDDMHRKQYTAHCLCCVINISKHFGVCKYKLLNFVVKYLIYYTCISNFNNPSESPIEESKLSDVPEMNGSLHTDEENRQRTKLYR